MRSARNALSEILGVFFCLKREKRLLSSYWRGYHKSMKTLPILAGLCAAVSFAFSQTTDMNKPLTPQEEKLVVISAYAAKGDMEGLKAAVNAGLDAGLSIGEIKEILVQLYAYCGFPRSLNALAALMGEVQVRAAAGKHDAPGAAPSPAPEGKSLDFGTANQTKLVGAPVQGGLFDFAPAIDEYLKAHLFGDIFARDNVSWRTRELATIAALSTMQGTESQLAAHIGIGKNNGLTDEQVSAILSLTRSIRHADAFPLGSLAGPAMFKGDAWVQQLLPEHGEEYDTAAYNVTFAPGTRNHWHSHSVGQILLCTAGVGYYQEKGKPARRLNPGDVVEIPANVEHWHGAAPDSFFSHIGITPKVGENHHTWGAPVTDEEYAEATRI